jgi:hypothetical protein
LGLVIINNFGSILGSLFRGTHFSEVADKKFSEESRKKLLKSLSWAMIVITFSLLMIYVFKKTYIQINTPSAIIILVLISLVFVAVRTISAVGMNALKFNFILINVVFVLVQTPLLSYNALFPQPFKDAAIIAVCLSLLGRF